MLNNGLIFNLGSTKVCSPHKIQTYLSFDKNIWIAVTDYYMYFYLIGAISISSYASINKFYSFMVYRDFLS